METKPPSYLELFTAGWRKGGLDKEVRRYFRNFSSSVLYRYYSKVRGWWSAHPSGQINLDLRPEVSFPFPHLIHNLHLTIASHPRGIWACSEIVLAPSSAAEARISHPAVPIATMAAPAQRRSRRRSRCDGGVVHNSGVTAVVNSLALHPSCMWDVLDLRVGCQVPDKQAGKRSWEFNSSIRCWLLFIFCHHKAGKCHLKNARLCPG